MTAQMKFGLIGHKISYSRSPDIFRHIFELTGLKGEFLSFDFPLESFAEQFAKVKESSLNGFSVTIPHKRTVMSFLDDIDSSARSIGAINSVHVDGSVMRGYNTDTYGFTSGLTQSGIELGKGYAMLLGYGGAARAATFSLYNEFAMRQFIVVGRDREKLSLFSDWAAELLPDIRIKSCLASDNSLCDTGEIAIIVNSTPLGGWNFPDHSPLPENFPWPSGAVYYDMNYYSDNKVLQQARQSGLIVLDGGRMLVGQAIRSLEIWSGLTVDFETLYSKVFL